MDQRCQMAKFDPFLSLDCARVKGVGAQSKERKGSNFAAQRRGAIVQKPEWPKTHDLKIWLLPYGNHGMDGSRFPRFHAGWKEGREPA